MTYQSLYRTYRPAHFDDVVGQEHIKRALQNAIKREQLAHAYLFCGPRGTGKTSVAKIFAQGINCLNKESAPCGQCEMCQSFVNGNHPDIVEIDAASNNGVDEIRDLIEKTKYAPLELKYKVYIIDEVHMLTQGAFNALLKTLEEPPEHVVFILATTEVHKVLATIISRTQRYDFERVSQEDIKKRLEIVLSEEDIKVEEGVLELIANLADGGMRDALTITEQVIAFASDVITMKDVQRVYKVVGSKEKYEFLESILLGKLDVVLSLIKDFDSQSIEFKRFINDLIDMLKEASIYSLTHNKELITSIQMNETIKLSDNFNQNDLIMLIDEFLNVSQKAMFNGLYQDYLEIASIKACQKFVVELSDPIDFKEPVIKEQQLVPEQKIVQQEQISSQEEVVKKEVKVVEKSSSDDMFLIECMVMGDKGLKEQELLLWPQMKEYNNDFRYRKVAPFLSHSTIAISDLSQMVIVLERSEEAALINSNPELVTEVVSKVLNTQKSVYAITVPQFNEGVELFRQLHEQKKLPSKESIIEKRQEEVKEVVVEEPSTEEMLSEFFGDSLSIIE